MTVIGAATSNAAGTFATTAGTDRRRGGSAVQNRRQSTDRQSMRHHTATAGGGVGSGTRRSAAVRAGFTSRSEDGSGRVRNRLHITVRPRAAYTESSRFDTEYYKSRNIPNPLELAGGAGAVGTAVFGLMFCAAGNLIWSTVSGERELGLREAYEVIGKCFLPPFAQAALHRYLLQHPEWDEMVKTWPVYTREYQLMIR